jgi:tol-pal system protein YbgF
VILLALTFGSGSARAQNSADIRELREEVERLDRALQDLQREVYRRAAEDQGGEDRLFLGEEGEGSASGTARFDRIQDIENELERLTDSIERTGFRVARLEERMEALEREVQLGLSPGAAASMAGQPGTPLPGQAGAAGSGQAGDTSGDRTAQGAGGQTGTTSQPSRGGQGGIDRPSRVVNPNAGEAAQPPQAETPMELFEQSLLALRSGELATAEAGFSAFLENNPDAAQTLDARFWRAEALFAQGDYERAAEAYLDIARNNPEADFAATSYLKLGSALSRMGARAEACNVLNDLRNRFPNAAQGVLRRTERAKREAGCT